MSDTTNSDVLMFFVLEKGGTAIKAESTSALAEGDATMMEGFTSGRYFEAENFSFGMDLQDAEGKEVEPSGDTRSFARWRALKSSETRPDPLFRTEPNDVSVSRKVDASSPVLLKHCLDGRRFFRAVLVKRARVGSSGRLIGVLRMEFTEVWLKAIEWEDGDAVRETCKFKYSAVSVTYVQRKPDGSVGTSWSCSWTSPKVAK